MKLPALFYISFLVEIGTAVVGGSRYRNLPRPLKILEWLILISIVEVAVQFIVASFHYHNLWTSHFYTLIEIIFMILMYSVWMKRHQRQVMLLWGLSLFVICWIVSKFTFEPLSLLDGWTSAISMILQITFSIFLLVDVVKESDVPWTDDPRLWVAAAIIIYSSGNLFIFALFNRMLQISPDRLRVVMSMNWILIIVSYLLYARGFLCPR
jgi:hypothetical protein